MAESEPTASGLKCGNSVHYWEVLMFVHFQRVALRYSQKPMLRNVRAGSNLFGHDNTKASYTNPAGISITMIDGVFLLSVRIDSKTK